MRTNAVRSSDTDILERRIEALDAALVEVQRDYIKSLVAYYNHADFDRFAIIEAYWNKTTEDGANETRAKHIADVDIPTESESYAKLKQLIDVYCKSVIKNLRDLLSAATNDKERVDVDRTIVWRIIDGIIGSAPVLVLSSDYADRMNNSSMSEMELAVWTNKLFLMIAAAAYPSIFKDVEKIDSLGWLAKVRDFKTLSSDEQKTFLKEQSAALGAATESDDWAKKCDLLLKVSQTKLIDALPAGLFTFGNWSKLEEISPEYFEACGESLRIRLRGAAVLEAFPPSSWLERFNRREEEPWDLSYVSKLLDQEIEKAADLVYSSEARRENQRQIQREIEAAQKIAAEEREAENAARLRDEIREFQNTAQPVPILPESAKLVSDFQKAPIGQKPVLNANRAKFIDSVAVVIDAELGLDYRGRARDKKGDPEIKELADILLSTTNLTIVAKAFGNDTDKHIKQGIVPSVTPVLQSAEGLGKLYHESDAVRDQVDKILSMPEGAVFVAAVVLPIDKVSEFVSFNGSKASTQDKELKLREFVDQIEDALINYDDIRTIRSVRSYESKKDALSTKKGLNTEIPEWVNQQIGATYKCFVDPEDGRLYLYLKEDSETFFEVPKAQLKDPEKFAQFCSKELAKAYLAKEYSKLLKELKALGFKVEIEHEQTKVSYVECGIEQAFSGEVREIKKLRQLKEQFEESQGRAEALKEFAEDVGFTPTETTPNGEAQITLGELTISIPKAITKEHFEELTETIDIELNEYNRAQQLAERRAANLAKEKARAEQEVKPEVDDKILVVDANVLLMWSAPVPGAQDPEMTYLELIMAYASQTGSRIWIPARVLYEVLGNASFLNSESELGDVSIRTYSSDISEPIGALIEGANHLSMLMSDGAVISYVAKRGSNSNITIVYTDEDREFYRRAKHARDTSRQERFAQSEKKRDLGDNAITDILRFCDVPGCQFTVLTGDATYANNYMPRESSSGEAVIWKKPGTVIYSVLTPHTDQQLDFPSANESMAAITEWWQARQVESSAGWQKSVDTE